jgi:hypothetical protein
MCLIQLSIKSPLKPFSKSIPASAGRSYNQEKTVFQSVHYHLGHFIELKKKYDNIKRR